MKLEYLKGSDNKVPNALSHGLEKLDEETIRELLNCTRIGYLPQAETENINVIQDGK